jgi:hypothetical protein
MRRSCLIVNCRLTPSPRAILCVVVCGVLATLLLAQGPCFAGLINGDAETGSIIPWTWNGTTGSSLTYMSESTGTVYPFEGSRFFAFPLAASAGTLTQTGTDLLDVSELSLTGMYQVERVATNGLDDYGEAILTICAADGHDLASVSSGMLMQPTNLTWATFSVTLPIPQGAASWRVDLAGSRRYGSYINVFYDSVKLTHAPEPSAIALLGVAAFGLLAYARRRKAA